MTDISFYHLTSTSLDQALPKLLEKALQGGFRAVVRVASETEAERVNGLLWTYNPDTFLPHGTARDGHSALQPIFITAAEDNPNHATLLVITDAVQLESAEAFERVLDIFNGADEQEVDKARARWKHYASQEHTVSYIKQNASGGWEKQSA
jgi:DNA polymerase III subunit chi